MMTREKLEAAVKFVESGPGFIDWGHMSILAAAARMQLALMAEKCANVWHDDDWQDAQTVEPPSQCPTCHGSGKVYPQETVEKIAEVMRTNSRRPLPQIAVAVLDAIGETP